MERYFNITGVCNPKYHYMVDIGPRLAEIKKLIDRGNYFTINRARQYGKTTTLRALSEYLNEDYIVIYLDFQMFGYEDFSTEAAFVKAFTTEMLGELTEDTRIPENVMERLREFSGELRGPSRLSAMFTALSGWCGQSEYPVVLLVDEADSASDYHVFISFLSQLRAYFNARNAKGKPALHSVILAGVYDIKNLKDKIHSGEGKDHIAGVMSPWNIAADFTVDMSFGRSDITGMLAEYEYDHRTGMDMEILAELIYDYTSGYPFLVSCICKLMDERITGSAEFPNAASAWTKDGFLAALRILLTEKNTLFESLVNKLADYPQLRTLVYSLLFYGKEIPYNSLNKAIEIAAMFGFVKNDKSKAVISNRIFETVLYNLFISEEIVGNKMYDEAVQNKNQFVSGGHLNMELVLEKFVTAFHDFYGDQDEVFVEEAGRRYFLLFLKPIINGTGNCYVEARTRNMRRTDVVVDYSGEQFVIELKLWHGNEYNSRGEKQLSDYLEYYHLQKGYLLSYNFNKKKKIGVKKVKIGDKVIVEAVV